MLSDWVIATFTAGADTNTPFLPIVVVVKSVLMSVIGTSSDELGGSRQLVFTADRARVAAKEVEVDKDRVVRAVRLHIQCQQGKDPQVKVGPVPVLVYLTSPRTWPVTAW